MPVYDCGAPGCTECQRAFGPDRSAAIANYHARDKAMAEHERRQKEERQAGALAAFYRGFGGKL